MKLSLENKTALICGGTSGIGLETAKLFSNAGCSLIILSRNKEKLLKTLDILKKNDLRIHKIIEADLSCPNIIANLFSDFFYLNRVDILINNSSGPMPKNILKCNVDDFQIVFNQHFLSVNIITQKALEQMRKRNYGRIINILGTSIKEPIPDFGLSSIKSATASWAKGISKEVGKNNITINNVLPGPTNTNELKKIISLLAKKNRTSNKEYQKKIEQDIDIGRIADPREIANVVLFLASDYSSFITGTNISVDGGYTSSL